MGWGHGSSGRMPAQQEQGLEFKPQCCKKKKKKVKPGMVVHVYNPSYSRGWGRRISNLRTI
jgi:hypothetical protein